MENVIKWDGGSIYIHDYFIKNKKLGTKDGEKDVYELAKIRKEKSRNLNYVTCFTGDDERVIRKNDEIKKRTRSYFSKIFK